MCVVRDECVLLVLLAVQLVGGLPVVALMKLCGVAYAALYVVGAVLGVSLTFAPRLRWCCSSFVGLINEFGICVFLLTHAGLLALASYSLYSFLLPFFHSSAAASYHDGVSSSGVSPTFEELCLTKKLSDNLSHTGCERLQELYALSLVVLPVVVLASSYLLLLGSRITRRNWSDSAHLLKHDMA